MDELVIEVERRESAGTGESRKLRQKGLIPAVVYGAGKETVPVVVDRHAVTELMRQERGRNTVFLLKMKGTKQERHAMLRDFQINPVTQQYIHMDFVRVLKGQMLKLEVPVVLEGESKGAKAGGFMDFVGRTLHVECNSDDIPQSLAVDVSELDLGEHLCASDVVMPSGVKLLDDPTKVLVVVETHGAKAEEEAAEVAAAPEGSEPEVIKRGKTTEEEG